MIQAENHLARDSAAFIPRVQLEETNPTFKHPENWDSLSLQDKAKLIIADQAVKLMELQCHKNTTRHQEDGEFTKHGAGLPDKKPSNLGGEAITDVAIRLNRETTLKPDDMGAKRDGQGHIWVNDKLQYISKDLQEGRERNTDV